MERTRKRIEYLTMNETIALFHDYGVPISYETLAAWIDERAVPWATSARIGGAGRYQRRIWRKPLVKWLEDLAEDLEIDEVEVLTA